MLVIPARRWNFTSFATRRNSYVSKLHIPQLRYFPAAPAGSCKGHALPPSKAIRPLVGMNPCFAFFLPRRYLPDLLPPRQILELAD